MKDSKIFLLFRGILALILAALAYILPEPILPFHGDIYRIVRVILLLIGLFIFLEKLFEFKIYTKIFIGLILGAIAGIVFKTAIVEIKPVGTAFIRSIQMIVIPLVFASLLVGAASLNPKKLGRVGVKTVVYYLITTTFAIFIGLFLANLLKPGSGLDPAIQTQLMENYQAEAGEKISFAQERTGPIETLLNIIPANPIQSLSQGKMLQIIFFALFMGIVLTLIPEKKASPVLAFFEGINEVMIRIVHIVIKIAPYGVFALIASVVGAFGLDILTSLLKYCLLTILGMIILYLIYPQIVALFSGMRPMTFIRGVRSAQLIAFSTSSSSATLPVTMEVCEENLGVPKDIASFVLPLGATINMDGTALYQGISAVFIAQVYGMSLTIGDQLMIVLTAILASVGTAGAPGVGMLMLVIVLKQIGIPLEGISLILGVERILDMFRTTLNVTGDASASVVISAIEGELKIENGKPKVEREDNA